MSPARALAACTLVLSACNRDPAEHLAAEALALQRAVPLPTVTTAGKPPSPRLRVIVSRSGVSVDDAALFASWPAPRRLKLIQGMAPEEAETLPFFHRDLVRFDGDRIAQPDTPASGQYDLPPLRHVLDFARDVEKHATALAEGEPGAIEAESSGRFQASIFAAGDVAFGSVVPVLYTLGQAEYAPVVIARGPGGDTEIGLDVPRGGDRAAAVRVVLRAEGAFVTAEAGMVQIWRDDLSRAIMNPPAGFIGKRVETDRAASTLGRPLVGPEGACPIPSLVDGGPDPKVIGPLLQALRKRMPEDTVVVLVPPAEMRWHRVVAWADAAAEAGFPRFMLALSRSGERMPDCRQSLPAGEVRKDDFPACR